VFTLSDGGMLAAVIMPAFHGYMTTVGVEYSVAALWRYPVKSMQGEELNAADITAGGLLGDRRFAVIDLATGKVAGAKNPRKWPGFFYFRAAYTKPPHAGSTVPAVRVTMPGGNSATTDEADLPKLLSEALGREVTLSAALPAAAAEEYMIADDEVASFDLPAGTFFDAAVVHLVTTATLDRLRTLYPEGRFEPRRFRPNIIVATGPDTSGFVENDWVGHEIALGEHVRLRVTMTTGRCVMTTLPQGDLPKDSGILRTVAQHNNAQVGVYAEVIRGGPVRRGEPITVL
jgi:MOSC domain-containing protein